MKHLHIIGICGTFMGNLALLARDLGFHVTGSDLNAYPPMSDLLRECGIEFFEGYRAENLSSNPDVVLVGNTISRTNPEVDAMLNAGVEYSSGPQWLYENLLHKRKVITVAGTHGKSTTSSMVAWILDFAGLEPGYLIGGVPQNFAHSSRIGESEWFVVEGDEYDTAYFDKRSKFIHYRPVIATCLNLEFDHADIFDSIEDVERQFQYFIRTLPSSGRMIANFDDERLRDIARLSPWASVDSFSFTGHRNADWYLDSQTEDYKRFQIHSRTHGNAEVSWNIPGQHNAMNALAAVATASFAGVSMGTAVEALQKFKAVKRRLEFLGEFNGVKIYDDFAHHPTAIRASVDAVSKAERPKRMVAVFEPRSNTMRMGKHGDKLAEAFRLADEVHMYRAPNVKWELGGPEDDRFRNYSSIESLLNALTAELSSGDCVLIMSNGGFNDLQNRLADRLSAQSKPDISFAQYKS